MASSDNFFEGTEKLLEVWFTCKDGDIEDTDLRDVPSLCLAKILLLKLFEKMFVITHALCLFSESSMFVSKQRFILKTCGTTTLLNCLNPLLLLVKKYTNFDEVQDIFYSRKNFLRPELQLAPHNSFEEEVKILDNFFMEGAAYCFGRINSDCWYLYTLNPLSGMMKRRGIQQPDQTFECLMTSLDPNVMKIFTKETCATSQEATELSRIDKLLPNMKIDDFLFHPCGYSMNGISKDGYYMTIHITPEPHCSYVSFETNMPMSSYNDLILRIGNTFKPNKFLMTVFSNKSSASAKCHMELGKTHYYNELRCLDLQFCKFKNYDLTYALFVKFPS
uniref:S-adenosylmethionine decarboxylase proenzyme n=1 Tax=Strigamia maritima TaxID=126957 RepID=T1IQC5_STRMM